MIKPLPKIKPQNRYRFDVVHEAMGIAAKSVGIEILAAALNKSPGTLRGELVLTKSDCKMKLGFDDAISAMFMSDDLTALHLIADLFDHVLVPREAEKADGSAKQRYLRLAGKAGQLVQAIADILADNQITENERQKVAPLLKELERLLATEAAET